MIQLDGNSLTLADFEKIVVGREQVGLAEPARQLMKKTRAFVEKAAQGDERVYSINTGFGVLSKVKIEKESLDQLQLNLIRSHCAGVGNPMTEDQSRGLLLLRANVLAKGFSGSRPEIVDLLVGMLNQGVHPVVPEKGSVGASGDLAPLAHLASVLIGEGEAWFGGKQMPGGEALKQAGLKPVRLEAKEGLSLINGTQQMTAIGALTTLKALRLADVADLIAATSLDGVMGSRRAFRAWVHETRPYAGQKRSALLMTSFTEGSEIYESHLHCDRVQDPYSFRCTPQVHGACRDLIQRTVEVLEVEMNAATDNPLVHPETGELVSNGNFHGQPVAFALDILAMGLAELGSISERRIAKLIDPDFSGLPTFLIPKEGLNSGLMMNHVTAAALVSENRLLSHPGSTDSVPTNVEKEDHVSMGPLCARKAQTVCDNVTQILSIEAFGAVQALDFRLPLQPGQGGKLLYELVRSNVEKMEEDRYLKADLDWIAEQIDSGAIHRVLTERGLV